MAEALIFSVTHLGLYFLKVVLVKPLYFPWVGVTWFSRRVLTRDQRWKTLLLTDVEQAGSHARGLRGQDAVRQQPRGQAGGTWCGARLAWLTGVRAAGGGH